LRNGVTLIVAILGSRDLWGDTGRLLEYGLGNYEALKTAPTIAAPSLSDGHVALGPEKPSSPLFSWEEERKVQSLSGYLLQIASFRERERAESLQKWITEGGYRAFLEKVSLNNGDTTYRVRVGPYAELVLAQEAAREIENKSGFKAIILPASAVSPFQDKPS